MSGHNTICVATALLETGKLWVLSTLILRSDKQLDI